MKIYKINIHILYSMRKIEKNSKQEKLYIDMYRNQSYNFVEHTKKYVANIPKNQCNIKNVIQQLNNFVDPSDPDVNENNVYHAYQTAEMIRKKEPFNLELQVVGLIHDVGKIIHTFSYFYDKPWAVVGDTFPVGCKFSDKILCSEFLKENPDYNNNVFNKKYGIYEPNCGIKNLIMSYGHDEYLFNVLNSQKSKHKLSDSYLNIIRYHSFYPWHTENEYKYFENESDKHMLEDIRNFNQYDLYSKKNDIDITDKAKKYYDILLDYYFPNDLQW